MQDATQGGRVEIVLPDLGNEVTEAEIDAWLVAEGEAVTAGQALVQITTPKLSMEIEAPAAGRLAEIHLGPGDIAEVGAVLGVIAPEAAA